MALLRTLILATLLAPGCFASDEPAAHGEAETNGTKPIKRFPLVEFHFDDVAEPYVIGLWILLASFAKVGFHLSDRLTKFFPESCLLIILGLIIGALLYAFDISGSYTLDSHTFFHFLLPPIVIDAGYFMPVRAFVDNLGAILTFAVVSTIFNTLCIGLSLWGFGMAIPFGGMTLPLLQALLFGSLISAVDPVAVLAVFEEIHVNEMLYIIVFGESLLNDAVSVVLYRMFDAFTVIGEPNIIWQDVVNGLLSFFIVGFGGVLVGIVFAFFTAFITKYTNHIRLVEPMFVFLLSYLSYMTAEMFRLSGILAATFCGIFMRPYVEANISQKSRTTIKYFMKMLSSIMETIIFVLLGLSTVAHSHDWNTSFILMTLIFCFVFRCCGVIIFTFIVNRFRVVRINRVEQVIMSYGGLRGAIAFCLASILDPEHIPAKDAIITATLAVVFATVFFQGITIKPLVNVLKIKRAQKIKINMTDQIAERLVDHTMAGIEDIVGGGGNHSLLDKVRYYNDRYIKKALIREKAKSNDDSILRRYEQILEKDAIDLVHKRSQSSISLTNIKEHENTMAALLRPIPSMINRTLSTSNLSAATSETVIDINAMNSEMSQRDIDDSEMHHLLSDNMFARRRKLHISLPGHLIDQDVHEPTPYHHRNRMHLRRLIHTSHKSKSRSKQRGHRDHHDDHDEHHSSTPPASRTPPAAPTPPAPRAPKVTRTTLAPPKPTFHLEPADDD